MSAASTNDTPVSNGAVYRYRAGNDPIFSASKAPPGPGLEHSCELPFGFLWTPLSPPSDSTTEWAVHQCHGASLPPVTCLTCCAYLNMYAETNEAEGEWVCPLCSGRNVTTPEVLQSAITQVPGIEFRQNLVEDSEGDSLTIMLVMDQNLPSVEAQAIGTAIAHVLEAERANADVHDRQVRLGLIVFGDLLHVYQLGNAAQGIMSVDIFSRNEQITDFHLTTRRYLTSLHDGLDGLGRALAAVYGVVLQPDDQNEDISGDDLLSRPLSRLEQLKRNKQERIRRELGETTEANLPASPWTKLNADPTKSAHHGNRCTGEAIQAAVSLVTAGRDKPARTARILLLTNGCPNTGSGSVVDSSGSTRDSTWPAPQRSQRIDIVDPLKLVNSIEFFSLIGTSSSEVGVAIDVLCSGSSELALPSYQALVEASSGYVLVHPTFEVLSITQNLQYLLQQTFVPGLHFTLPDTPGSSVPVTDESWIDGCILDIRIPSFLTVTHMVGPGDILEDSKRFLANEGSSFAVGVSLAVSKKRKIDSLPMQDVMEATMMRIRLGRFDPMSTFSFMCQINEFFQHESHAIIQCIARYVKPQGHVLATRVFTRRLAIAKDVGEFLDVVDEEVIPVLLGKEAVYRAIYGRDSSDDKLVASIDPVILDNYAYDAQQDIDATIQRISVAYRLLGLRQGTARRGIDLTEEGGLMTAGSSIDFAFPPELTDSLRRIYHLRRGPLISPGPLQSLDDRAQLRALFLRLPLEECLSMMALSLWSSGLLKSDALTTHVTTVPPDTLALWDDVILAADHFYELFVWSGQGTSAPRYDSIRQHFKRFLEERSKDRFPAPALYLLKENDSMCRRFISLLAPSHADPEEHQLAHFPELGKLSPEHLQSVQSKFKFHDHATDPSFRSWFWNVSSASSQSKDERISLCD